MIRFTIRALIVIAMIPVIALIAWYAVSFLPYSGELQRMAAEGNNRVESVADTLYPLAVAGETKHGIRNHALKQAYVCLVFSKHRGRMLKWHLNTSLWCFAGRVHFNEREIFGLWVYCGLGGCGKGLPETAERYYGKNITHLSRKQLAGLVAAVKHPTKYKPGTEESETRIKDLLEKAEGA